ncbi:hypothetical protein NP493_228g01004 [Ridgeia piscesae]|uniref:THAP-type domain-containing protein n=1 Tax=Ridgeia piscesae TaxID=27915 RepID=A0AAD9UDQ8_RIDPI|nr:hypothetical protein NP493_228g01004 [Ridgeia piscesae]
MPKSCCAVACHNHNMMKDKKVSFHIFPVDQKRRDKWIVAVKRVNSDGSGWQPTRYTVLCGEHFMTGRPRDDPHHPDYIPSVFCRCPKNVSEKTRKHPHSVKVKKQSSEQRTANSVTVRPQCKWHSHQIRDRGNISGVDGSRDITPFIHSSPLVVTDTIGDNIGNDVEPSAKRRGLASAAACDVSPCAATRIALPACRNPLLMLADVALRDEYPLSYEVSNVLA